MTVSTTAPAFTCILHSLCQLICVVATFGQNHQLLQTRFLRSQEMQLPLDINDHCAPAGDKEHCTRPTPTHCLASAKAQVLFQLASVKDTTSTMKNLTSGSTKSRTLWSLRPLHDAFINKGAAVNTVDTSLCACQQVHQLLNGSIKIASACQCCANFEQVLGPIQLRFSTQASWCQRCIQNLGLTTAQCLQCHQTTR